MNHLQNQKQQQDADDAETDIDMGYSNRVPGYE